MKKLILLAALMVGSIATANAQIVYKAFYGDSEQQAQQEQQNQKQVQTVRSTAYYADSQGNIIKVPIQIRIETDSYGSTATVVAEYKATMVGDSWETLAMPASISKCIGTLSSNQSEKQLAKQFMYTAQVFTTTYYFDF